MRHLIFGVAIFDSLTFLYQAMAQNALWALSLAVIASAMWGYWSSMEV